MAYTSKTGIIVYEREDIGLRRPRSTAPLGTLTKVTFHHGGPVGGYRDTKAEAIATWKSWQNYHMDTHGWVDIGYHLGVDARGRLYEGRSLKHLGAHVAYHNTGNIGINFMQDGRYYELTELQRATVKTLFEDGVPELGLRPLKYYATHPSSAYGVYTHREFGGTECPGDEIQRHIAWRRGLYF